MLHSLPGGGEMARVLGLLRKPFRPFATLNGDGTDSSPRPSQPPGQRWKRPLKQLWQPFATHRLQQLQLFGRAPEGSATVKHPDNQLRTFFDNRKVGNGIWKWLHYFDIYERHFSRFRGQEVHIAEIGIYSGGSLEMWRDYFGPKSHIYGVDIEPECKVYERDRVKVFIGDQADRSFWKEFCTKVPNLDIVIDDGGHQYEQQVVSLEELLPHLRPGGVYLCEDVHGASNRFATYVSGLAHKLNEMPNFRESPDDPERRLVSDTTTFQKRTNSIHFYPFVIVVEKNRADVLELVAPKHGTQWQPFAPYAKGSVVSDSSKLLQ
jgi:hypothetical protein